MADETVRSVVDKKDGVDLANAISECMDLQTDEIAGWKSTVQLLEEAVVVAKLRLGQLETASAMGGAPDEDMVATLAKVSCLVPRSKAISVDFGRSHLTLKGKDFTVTTPYTNINAMLKLPRHHAVEKLKVASYEFVLRLAEPVPFRKTTLSYIAFDVSATSPIVPDDNIVFHLEGLDEDPVLEDKVLHEITEMFFQKFVPDHPVIQPAPLDTSSMKTMRYTSTQGDAYVKCYRKTNSGLLYFLPEGVVFLNPPLFYSRQEIASISQGRDTSLSLRTFDLTVELVDQTKIEFSMLEKQEIPSITEFAAMLKALKKADELHESQPGSAAPAADEDSDEDDSDYVMSQSEDDYDDYDGLSGSAYSDSGSDSEDGGPMELVAEEEEGPLGQYPDAHDMQDI